MVKTIDGPITIHEMLNADHLHLQTNSGSIKINETLSVSKRGIVEQTSKGGDVCVGKVESNVEEMPDINFDKFWGNYAFECWKTKYKEEQVEEEKGLLIKTTGRLKLNQV